MQKFGKEESLDYLTANRLSIDAYRHLIHEENIRECASFIYTLEENDLIEKEEKAAVRLGIDAQIPI